jgi:hypothetical protein
MSRSEPEPAAVSTDDPSSVADVLRQHVTRVLQDDGAATVDADELRSLVSSVTRLYAACSDRAGYEIRAIDETVSPTDAVALACALIRAHNLNPFDLAIWYSRGTAIEPRGMPDEEPLEGSS